MIFNQRIGGAGSGASASIFVYGDQLQSTDTVYAQKDGQRINGAWNSARSGFIIAPIPEYGTWVLTAGSGTKTRTILVRIDAAEEFEAEVVYHLPSAYQEVQYLESTGNQWFDSGIIGRYGLSTKAKVQQIEGGNGTLLACRNGTDGRVYLGYRTYNETINIGYKREITSSSQYLLGEVYECEYEICDEKATVKLNGSVIIDTFIEPFSSDISMYVFANNSTTMTFSAPLRCYYLKVFENQVLIRDFIPCYRKSDHKPGMYDIVNAVFYVNQGTGADFSVGGDIT